MNSNNRRLDQLTSIRGIAAWWVVVYHSQAFLKEKISPDALNVISYGYLAVDLFFVLSGFVLFLNYHSRVNHNAPKTILLFYWNRFARIYPLHFVMMISYLVLTVTFFYFSSSGKPPGSYSTETFIQSLLLMQTWGNNELTWNVPSWSISSEWAAYMIFPLIIFFMRKYLVGITMHIFLSIFVLFSISYIYNSLGMTSIGSSIAKMAIIRTLFEFTLGCVIASVYINHTDFIVKFRYLGLVIFIGACLIFAKSKIDDYFIFPIAFFSLIAYLSVDTSYITRFLNFPLLVYLGEISYSTYMVHYFIYDILKAGIGTVYEYAGLGQLAISFFIVLLASMAMHHTIEIPSQRYLRNIFSNRKQVK